MPKLILGFVGLMASGKGTCCQYLADRYGARSHRFSTILRDMLNRVYLPQTRDNLQQVSSALRATFGDDLLATTIAKDVAADPGALVTVDGVRRPPDIKFLRRLDGFWLVGVIADERTRYERSTQRNENPDDEHKTFADFARDGQQEAERQIVEVMASADFTLDNNGTFEELHRQLDAMLKKLGATRRTPATGRLAQRTT